VFILRNIKKKFVEIVPENIRNNMFVKYFGFTKVPMLFYIRPSVKILTEEKCVVKIPLSRRTKNHLNSMYFGALAAGADLAGGIAAMKLIHESGERISLSFKEFQANFLKRAEGDTYFTCNQGKEIKEFVSRVSKSSERENMPITITATCPDKLGEEAVAEFTLILSLKKKS
jgi:acyl-coenzyme A thioesterase PaaI-like protein